MSDRGTAMSVPLPAEKCLNCGVLVGYDNEEAPPCWCEERWSDEDHDLFLPGGESL